MLAPHTPTVKMILMMLELNVCLTQFSNYRPTSSVAQADSHTKSLNFIMIQSLAIAI